MNIISLLDGSGFIKLNKALNHYLGTNNAIFLAEIIGEHEYWRKKEQLTEDGFFFSTVENVWYETGLKRDVQMRCIKNLVNLNLISFERRGANGSRHFKIHEQVLVDVLEKAQNYWEQERKKYISKLTNKRILSANKRKSLVNSGLEKTVSPDIGKYDVPDIGKYEVTDIVNCEVNNNNVNKNKEIRIYTTQPVVSYKSCDPFQTTTKVQLEKEKVHKRKRRLALVEEQINEKVTAPVSETVTERLSDIDGATARENKRLAEETELQKEIKTKKSIRNNKKKARMKIAKEKTSNPEILSLLETYLDNNYEAHNYVIPDSAWRLSLDKLFSFSHDDKKIIQIIKDNIASCNRSFYCTDKGIKNQASFDNTAHFKTHKALHDLTDEELQEFDSKLARNDDGTYLSF